MSTAKFASDGLHLTRALLDFVRDATVRETPTQVAIRAFTAEHPAAAMMIAPEQGQLMRWFARLLGARRIIEVGSFTGYSATWLAGGLAEGGELVACDISAEHLEIARGFWDRAGLADCIRPRLGPGADSLKWLLGDGWGGSVDLIFVDADKTGYATYYELGLELLRPGGVMLFDNTLWSGKVADPSVDDPDTVALRQISRHAADDPRVEACLLTDADGILAVLKP